MKITPYTIVLLSMSISFLLPSCKPEEKTAAAENPGSSEQAPAPTAPDSPEAVVKQIAKLQNDMAVVMESITDASSAEAALPKIAPIAEEFAKIGKKMKSMDSDMSPELKTKLEGIMQPAMQRMQEAMTKAMPTIAKDPDLAKRFQDAMAKMQEE
jgi:hypothetical protein